MDKQIYPIGFSPLFSITQLNNQQTLTPPTPLYLNGASVALSTLYVYYSWDNITQAFGNNQVQYVWVDGQTYTINFPDGYYSISDMNGFIQLQMQLNGHYLVDGYGNFVYYMLIQENAVYYCETLTVTAVPTALPTGWTNPNNVPLNGNAPCLKVNNAKFGTLIGFPLGQYPSVQSTTTQSFNSSTTPQISPITSVNVTCDIANTGDLNKIANVIYTFSAGDTSRGGQIAIEPPFPMFYRATNGPVPKITLKLLDQNGNDLNMRDGNWTATLLLKQ